MARGPRYSVKFRRRREGRTDYRKRLRLLKSGKPRVVVRKTSRQIIVQLVSYANGCDNVITGATSLELGRWGWKYPTKNLPAAYLTGLLCGLKALGKGVKEAVVDFGLHPAVRGSRLFAALRGVVDAGISVSHGEEVFPSEERLCGKHIEAYRGLPVPEDFSRLRERIVEAFKDAGRGGDRSGG